MTLYIFEAGLNHLGRIDLALKLCDLAKSVGADVIKFQRRNPDVSTPDAQKDLPKEWLGNTISYLEYRKIVEFKPKDYDTIDSYCRKIGLRWTASVWDLDSLAEMEKYDVPWIKIPSAMLNNLELIEAASNYNLILSTGMSTLKEISNAVDRVNPNTILLHCNSSYPCEESEVSLSLIPKLAEWFGLPVGFSSHTVSPFPVLYAVTLGAVAVEVHGTLSRALPGGDQAASLEEKALRLIRREIDRISVVMGTPEKKVWDSELSSRLKLRGY